MKRIIFSFVVLLSLLLNMSSCDFGQESNNPYSTYEYLESTQHEIEDVISNNKCYDTSDIVPLEEYPIMAYSECEDSLILIGAYRNNEGFVSLSEYEFGGVPYEKLGEFDIADYDSFSTPSLQNDLISVGDRVVIYSYEGAVFATCTNLSITYFRDAFPIIHVETDKKQFVKGSFAIQSNFKKMHAVAATKTNRLEYDIDADGIDDLVTWECKLETDATVKPVLNIATQQKNYTAELECVRLGDTFKIIGIYDFDEDGMMEIVTYINGLEEEYRILTIRNEKIQTDFIFWIFY